MGWVWLLYPLGVTNVAGRPYAWWSGSGSVLLPPLITLAGIALLYAWHHQCRERGCFRVVRHAPAGSKRYCHRHPHEGDAAPDDPALAAMAALTVAMTGLAEAIRATAPEATREAS